MADQTQNNFKACNGKAETYSIEFASVVITVVDADLAAIDASVAADREVVWHEGAAVGLQDNLALEEGTLRSTRVGLLGLSHHDRLVFQVVEDCHFPDLEIFKTTLDDVLFEVTVESQDL